MPPRNLFVGGLPYETTQQDLERLFAPCGTVVSAKVIIDRDTGRSKGFGFVEMSSEPEAKAAVRKLDGSYLGQRKLFVNEARPQDKPSSAPGASAPPAAGLPPGITERRSGKDRRKPGGVGAPTSEGDRRESFGGERKFGGAKPWEKRGGFGGEKKFGGPKKWGDKPAFGEKKFGDKKFGGPKPWEKRGDKPGFGGDKKFGGPKKWGGKPGPGGPGGPKKFGPKKWGSKPGGFKPRPPRP